MKLLVENSPTDGPVHVQNTLLLSYLAASSTITDWLLYVAALADPDDVTLYIPAGTNVTKSVIIRNQVTSQLIIICGGMAAYAQVPLCLQSWADTLPWPTAYNTYALGAAYLASSISVVPTGGYRHVRLIGHSYGGAVCMQLPPMLVADYSSVATLHCYTYGAPKPSSRNRRLQTSLWLYRRCFSNQDPVPSLPLASSDIGSLWAYVGVPTARAWSQWSHGISGLVYDGLQHLVVSDNPTFPADPTVFYLSLARWASGSAAFGADTHTLAAYHSANQLLVPAAVVSDAPHTIATTPPRVETARVMSEERALAVAIQALNIEANPGDAVAGITSGVQIIPGVRFSGRKHGRQHVIYYGTEVITYVRTERQQKAMVRRLNLGLSPI